MKNNENTVVALVDKKGYKANCKAGDKLYLIDVAQDGRIAGMNKKNKNWVFLKKGEWKWLIY